MEIAWEVIIVPLIFRTSAQKSCRSIWENTGFEKARGESPGQEGKKRVTQFNLGQAMKAQAALRAAAGEGEETFDEQQLVGMLSDEIRALRESGSTDEDISKLLKADAELDLPAETIGEFYVDTSGYQPKR